MRTPVVAGNWKMNCSTAEAGALIEGFLRNADARSEVEVVVFPPYLAIARVREQLRNHRVKFGAQDVFWAESGAFTGQISAGMLADVGCTHCLVGHSETRGRFGKLEVPAETVPYFAETDETCALKIQALVDHALTPVLCVGETIGEREDGRSDTVIQRQLEDALKSFEGPELHSLIIAYEPVWAIGTGKTCDSGEAERICAMIRAWLGERFGGDFADRCRVLYGGSVKAANAKELFSMPNIDGGLVGGASLNAEEFLKIVMSA